MVGKMDEPESEMRYSYIIMSYVIIYTQHITKTNQSETLASRWLPAQTKLKLGIRRPTTKGSFKVKKTPYLIFSQSLSISNM